MPIKLISGGGGSLTVTPASTSSNYTLTVPAVTANVITSGDVGTITGSMIAANTISPSTFTQSFTAMPVVNTIGGLTSYTLASNIPSWVKRVTISFVSLTINASTNPMVQLVTSAGTITSGYTYYASYILSTVGTTNYTTGFGLRAGSPGAGDTQTGSLVLYNVTGNTWQASLTGILYSSGNYTSVGAGWIALSNPLTGLILTSSGGATTYSGGQATVFYE